MRFLLNTQPVGLALGLIAPMIVFLGFYFFKYSEIHFSEFLDFLISRNVIVQVLSICVIINLLLFFIFIWTNRLYAARGVIMATFIYAIIVVIFKVI
jgi:hypothetical protein